MFGTTLEKGPRITVNSRRHVFEYATDGSLPNPLDATYAALAGCAAVYAKKACRELSIDDTGIRIDVRVISHPAQPLMPARVVTQVMFPERFDPAQRARVLASVERCPVKALIQAGRGIEFTVAEADEPGRSATVA